MRSTLHLWFHLDGGAGPRARTREVTLWVAVVLAYAVIPWLTWGDAMENARRLLQVEAYFGLRWEASMQGWIADREALRTAMSWYYIPGHYLAFLPLLLWNLIGWKPGYWAFRNGAMTMIVTGHVAYWAIPTAPPRLMAEAGVQDYVTGGGGVGFDNGFIALFGNENAAFPSEHAAWPIMVAWGLARLHNKRWLLLAIPHALWTAWLIVATGHHYVLDVGAGWLVAGGSILVAERTLTGRWLWDRKTDEPGGPRGPAAIPTGAGRQETFPPPDPDTPPPSS